ncbi:MAG: hypothetical protein SYNGOMJ08_00570 [Candidatus Syntrophoarchaeum sp. GoM_oil]|nr:MAG: hypothetical protein SYNGOMJ08_00570 [Candidatus Syntrophoarchaeum sp. GoM_oil]
MIEIKKQLKQIQAYLDVIIETLDEIDDKIPCSWHVRDYLNALFPGVFK